MNKLVLIESPFSTKSGYGYRSYDFIASLIELYPEWDIKLVPLPWGNTPQNALDENNKQDKKLLDRILKGNNLTKKPDIHIQITIANECRPLGDYNILITAGIETDIVSPKWIEGANKMDLILVSSKHSKQSFLNAKYNKMDANNKLVEELALTTEIDTLFEGFDPKVFYKTDEPNTTIDILLEPIKNDFNFLFVGTWLQGELGEDRKNVGMLVYTFLEEFKTTNKEEKLPSLILKTQGATPSKIDEHRITKMIDKIKTHTSEKYPQHIFPDINLLHGELSSEELNALYNHKKINTYISYSAGEGWNRTPLEFSQSNKPIIISDWSGHLDYLNSRGSTLLKGGLKQVHPSVVMKDVIESTAKWFKVDSEYAKNKMRDIFNNYQKYVDKTRMQKTKDFTKDKMKERIKELFDKHIKEDKKQIQFNL